MTAQEAAYKILNEEQKPLQSRKIAEIALNKGYVASSSKDPVFSIATTIEKNIRDKRYNSPHLVFLHTRDGRKIGLPSMEEASETESTTAPNQNFGAKKRVSVELPEEIIERIQLASQAKLTANFDDTVALLLQKGLSVSAAEIRKRLLRQLEKI